MQADSLSLTDAQVEAMRQRFGSLLDVEAEIRDARSYLEQIHTGKKPKRFSRFVWNWLRTSEDRRTRQMRKAAGPVRQAAVRPIEQARLTLEQLAAMADDETESAEIRVLAREQLQEAGVCRLF